MGKKYLKYIFTLQKKDQFKLFEIIKKIEVLDLKGLDIKKMKGNKNFFRVREGKIRIIFEKINGEGYIVDINSRGDIYKNF